MSSSSSQASTPITPTILNTLLEKTSHYDKDERYMATSDLCTALGTGINLDDVMEKKICAAILKQLDDKSNDVQSMAVKCLGTLLKKVQQAQVSEICVKLCSLILQGQSELRDIYSIGLKTLIADVPDTMGPLVVDTLTEKLITGINSENDDIKRESLDNMTDLLKRFGHLMKSHHEIIFRIVIQRLENKKPVVRKRASVCLGSLAVVVSDSLLFTLVNDLLRRIESLDISSHLTPDLADDIRIIIQTIGTISRTVGYRLGKSLNQIIPLFIKCCGGTSHSSDVDESQEGFFNDLREHCFPGLESFILRCPNEIAPHVPAILQLSIHYMKYDPNYCYDENDDNENDNEEEENEEDEEGDDDEYGGSDDDDSSWKIRKATIKVIQAIAISRVEMIQDKDLFIQISNELLGRLKEREESVRIEIVNCLTSLFNTALLSAKNLTMNGFPSAPPALTLQRSSEMPNLSIPSLTRQQSRESQPTTILSDVELNVEIIDFLQMRLSFILRLSRKQLSSQSLKIKSPVYKMLEILVKLLQGSFEAELPTLLREIVRYMENERTEGIKLSALNFVHAIFHHHSRDVTQPYLPVIIPVIVKYCRDDWYKITTGSLKMLEELMIVAQPPADSMDIVSSPSSSSTNSLTPFIPTIYQAILYRLDPVDLDQEIKESAISCAGQFLYSFGQDLSQVERDTLVALLQRRLENEPSRISALKAFILISHQSNGSLHIAQQLNEVLTDVALYLKQNNRLLKQTTLLTICSVLKHHSAEISANSIQSVLRELLVVFNENDLNIIDTTLQILSIIFQNFSMNSQVIEVIRKETLPRVFDLACSSWIYGIALKSLISLLQLFGTSNLPHFTFHDLESQLISHFQNIFTTNSSQQSHQQQHSQQQQTHASSNASLNVKHSLTNLSLCISSICLCSSVDVQNQTIMKYVTVIEKSNSTTNTSLDDLQHLSSNKYFSFLCLGFIGQHLDIRPTLNSKSINLDSILFNSFSTDSDDIKSLISHTLGYLAIGNLSYYVPLILQELNRNPPYQYYLLMALREVFLIALKEKLVLDMFISDIVNNLFQFLSSEEENLRNILAESLGSLTVLYPTRLINLMNETLLSSNPDSHAILTLTNSMKFFFSRYVAMSGVVLPSLTPLIDLLAMEDDLEILKSTIQLINSAVHYNVTLIRDYLTPPVIGKIIHVLGKKAERVIDLGPFKHRVDDALPLRKAALTCCETILTVTPRTIDSPSLLEALIQLLIDNKEETNLQCHQILGKLCDTDAGAVLCVIDRVIDPIEKSMMKNLAKEIPQTETSGGGASGGGGGGGGGSGGSTTAAPAGPETERAYEQLRSSVRLITSVNNLPEISTNRRWTDFLTKIMQKPSIVTMMNSSDA